MTASENISLKADLDYLKSRFYLYSLQKRGSEISQSKYQALLAGCIQNSIEYLTKAPEDHASVARIIQQQLIRARLEKLKGNSAESKAAIKSAKVIADDLESRYRCSPVLKRQVL